MKTRRSSTAAAVLAMGLLGLAGCGKEDAPAQGRGATAPNVAAPALAAPPAAASPAAAGPLASGATSSAASAAEQKITIDNFVFKPATLTVKVGDKVTWVNQDDVPHTATASVKPRAFDSGALDTDDKFTFTFTKAGTYDYFCAVHPHMKGQVVVTP